MSRDMEAVYSSVKTQSGKYSLSSNNPGLVPVHVSVLATLHFGLDRNTMLCVLPPLHQGVIYELCNAKEEGGQKECYNCLFI